MAKKRTAKQIAAIVTAMGALASFVIALIEESRSREIFDVALYDLLARPDPLVRIITNHLEENKNVFFITVDHKTPLLKQAQRLVESGKLTEEAAPITRLPFNNVVATSQKRRSELEVEFIKVVPKGECWSDQEVLDEIHRRGYEGPVTAAGGIAIISKYFDRLEWMDQQEEGSLIVGLLGTIFKLPSNNGHVPTSIHWSDSPHGYKDRIIKMQFGSWGYRCWFAVIRKPEKIN
ncbi:hypothetical protein ACFL24_00055 [Patescibacteria group bacterium]